MKRMYIFILLISCFKGLYSNEVNITDRWVQNQRIMRRVHIDKKNMNELDKLDTRIIETLKNNNFKDYEKEVSDLLVHIIMEKNYNSPLNSASAIDLLFEKFENKQLAFDAVYQISNYRFISNHYIVTAILKGFTGNMTSNPEKMFLALSVMQDYIDAYIVDPRRAGAINVVTNLIRFIRQYIVNTESGHMEDKYYSEIKRFVDRMELESKSSSFDNYAGASDLKREYFIYKEERQKR